MPQRSARTRAGASRGCWIAEGRQGAGVGEGRGRGQGRTWDGALGGAERGPLAAWVERLWLHHVPDCYFSGFRPEGLAGRERWANQFEPAG